MTATLSVVRYLSLDGNVKHWCLYLEHPPHPITIYEVVGEPTTYLRHTESLPQGIPQDRFIARHEVCQIDSQRDVEETRRLLGSQGILNENAGWMCQDFVLNCLEGVLGDYEYYRVKEELERVYDE